MIPEEWQQAARELISDAVAEIEYLSVCEAMEDADEADHRAVDALIRAATVTVTWPEVTS